MFLPLCTEIVGGDTIYHVDTKECVNAYLDIEEQMENV